MYIPGQRIQINRNAKDGLKDSYLEKKSEYFELCLQYNLPPRDLSLTLMGKSNLESKDRARLIRLVIHLMDLEKLLDPDLVENYLFSENESHYVNSGIFRSPPPAMMQ